MPKTSTIEKEVVSTAVFKFKKITLDEALRWSMNIVLSTTLPESFREYTFKFSLNETPFKMRIEDLERRKAEIKADKQGDLFPSDGARKTQLKNIDQNIAEAESELKEALKATPEIEFDGVIDKLEYKNGETIITFRVPALSIDALNTNRSIFMNYKVELLH